MFKLVQNLFKWVQMCSNLFKTCSNGFKLVQNLLKCVQMGSKLVQLCQMCSSLSKTCSNVFKCVQNFSKIISLSSGRGPTWQAELDLVSIFSVFFNIFSIFPYFHQQICATWQQWESSRRSWEDQGGERGRCWPGCSTPEVWGLSAWWGLDANNTRNICFKISSSLYMQ